MIETAPDGNGGKSPGRLSKTLLGLFMKRAIVAAVHDINDRFRLVTLEGAPLRGLGWKPGQKIQIAMGSAFVSRTYTPMDWDATAGRIRILGYVHGDGLGSAWLRGLRAGHECDLFGPRSSLDAGRMTAPLAIVGDETSIGLAHALASKEWADAVSCCFEVSDIESVEHVLVPLGLERATLIAKREKDAHVDDVEAVLGAPIAAGASFILTGKVDTIQRLRQNLKQRDVPSARIFTKAYWAPGKRGLD